MHFAKGEDKEEVARPLIDAAAREGGEGKVVLIGIAQEKASVWRSSGRPPAGPAPCAARSTTDQSAGAA
ncbi:MAG: hypothetical protein ACRDZ3_07955 [Acidimicrobiia bacterium]